MVKFRGFLLPPRNFVTSSSDSLTYFSRDPQIRASHVKIDVVLKDRRFGGRAVSCCYGDQYLVLIPVDRWREVYVTGTRHEVRLFGFSQRWRREKELGAAGGGAEGEKVTQEALCFLSLH